MLTSILLIDEQSIFRAGMRMLIDAESDLAVVGEAINARDAVGQGLNPGPDLVVLAIDPRDDPRDGQHAESIRSLKATYANAKVLALSIRDEISLMEDVLRAGATGFLLKGCAPDELLEAIRSVTRGETVVSTAFHAAVLAQYRRLLTGDTVSGTDEEKNPPRSESHRSSVLGTKLHRPRVPSLVVPRERLWALLDWSIGRPLTLVSAPAGYGKSTLISQWLEARTHTSAWISLDESDNDLRTFLTYWVEALERLCPESLPQSASLLEATQLPPLSVLTATLVNEMAQLEDDYVLVLDDYHQIDTPAIHTLLRDILRHPPASLHLIMATRVDPSLNLLQMRARSRMGEIRAYDLRFAVDETAAFLGKALDAPAEDAVSVALTERTEGWVTGMVLIALAAEQSADLAGGLSVLPGEHQTLDYLVAEALVRQPQILQVCLLKISILSRFDASLCEAICAPLDDGEPPEITGAYFIRWLVERNLFVVSLDSGERWFRYHQLFQELLQSQLAKTLSAEKIKVLHARACDWYFARDMADDAFNHAIQAGDLERAIDIVEAYRHAELDADRCHIVERWLDRLPPKKRAERPELLLAKAWTDSHRHRMARVPSLIAQIDALLVGKTVDPMLLADLNYLRGNVQYWAGEGEESVRSLEAVSVQIMGQQRQIEYNVELMLAFALCTIGCSEDATRRLGDRIRGADTIAGQYKTHLMGGVAIIHLIGGDLSKTRSQAERLHVEAVVRQFANNDAWSAYLRGCADLHACHLDSAASHFAAAIERRYTMHRGAAVDAMVGMVVAQQLQKQDAEATQALELLLDFAHETNDANVLAVATSCQARLHYLRGDLALPMQWVQTAGELQIPRVPFIWIEVPGITFCRVLIGSGIAANMALAEQRLRKMRRLYEANHFVGQTIEVIVLQAMALARQERTDEALTTVADALALAMPGGWLRSFVEAGPPIAKLLEQLPRQDMPSELKRFIGKILSVQPDRIVHEDSPGLLEPLTEREEEIVRLLATELSAKEIAEYLVVSVSTVRAHIRSIYGKMDVHGRSEAVQRAKNLGIL